MKKLPWGIFASICGQLTLYLAIGTIVSYVILNKIANQTNDTASLFGTWWQVLMFAAAIVFALGAAFCLVMFVLKKKANGEKRL